MTPDIKTQTQLSTPALKLQARLSGNQQLDLEFAEFGTAFRPIAQLYERLRYMLDYKETHLLRRQALQRILRRYLSTKLEAHKATEGIAQELVWAKYIDSNQVPQRVMISVTNSITKYRRLLSAIPAVKWQEYTRWLLGLASTEIEEKFFPDTARWATCELLTEILSKRIVSEEKEKGDWDTQLYIASQRALNRTDAPTIQYYLVLRSLPNFADAPSELTEKLCVILPELYKKLNDAINDRRNARLTNFIKKYIPAYIILRDFIETDKENAAEALSNKTYLSAQARILASERYRQTGKRLRNGAARSIIYVFFTKVVMAVAMEIPYDNFFRGGIEYYQLGINIFFPPILMFLITLVLHAPKETNTDRILIALYEMLYVEPENCAPISMKRKKTPATLIAAFSLIYLFAFMLSFGLIGFGLWYIDFSLLSGGIFIFILCLVSFFGFRLRNTANELLMTPERQSIGSTLVDFFALPFLKAGHWLTRKFQKINIFLYLADYILEAPLKTLISIAEQWTGFVKEKKDEIQADS